MGKDSEEMFAEDCEVKRNLKNKLIASKLQIDVAKPRTRKELDCIRGVLQKAKELAGEEAVTRFFARSKDIQEKILPYLGDIFSEEGYSKSDSANKQEKESNAANGQNCKDENDRNKADGQKSDTRSVQSPLFRFVNTLPTQRDTYTTTARNIMTCCNQLWHSDKSKYAPVVAPSLRSIMELAFNRLRESNMLDITSSSSFTGRQENTQVLALQKRMLENERELTDAAKQLGESFTSVKNLLKDEKYFMEAYTSANSWAHTSTLIGGDTRRIEEMAPRIELFALLLFMWPEVK